VNLEKYWSDEGSGVTFNAEIIKNSAFPNTLRDPSLVIKFLQCRLCMRSTSDMENDLSPELWDCVHGCTIRAGPARYPQRHLSGRDRQSLPLHSHKNANAGQERQRGTRTPTRDKTATRAASPARYEYLGTSRGNLKL
jgi:hypothetical protein